MDDFDFIRETMRAIGEQSLSIAQETAIMAAPAVTAPIIDDVDQALHRHAIVRETLKAFGRQDEEWRDIYSTVWIACRNIKEGWDQVTPYADINRAEAVLRDAEMRERRAA